MKVVSLRTSISAMSADEPGSPGCVAGIWRPRAPDQEFDIAMAVMCGATLQRRT